jgi:uncharacterized membrane protein YeaQ/YmgE (transglycosylase-associated protein family)
VKTNPTEGNFVLVLSPACALGALRQMPGGADPTSAQARKRRYCSGCNATREDQHVGIIWTIIIGFLAGLIAKWIHPSSNEPSGFILTTILGIVGAFLATYLGQAIGWYRAGEGAGLIGAIVGAFIILVIWGLLAPRRA